MINRIFLVGLFFLNWGVNAQFKNIQLASQQEDGKPMVEPSITINPKDKKNIIAAYSLDQIKFTKDGGETWSETTVTSPFGVYGDVVLESDQKGTVYFFHLSDPSGEGRSNEAWLDRIVAHKSDDGGQTWDEGKSIGYNPPKDQDKPWATINPKNGNIVVTWTQFDKYASDDANCHSNILYSTSSNGGKKWSDPIQLNQTQGDCLDGDNTTEGAVPAISLDGKMFVVWSNGGKIYMDRTYDEKVWLRNDLEIASHVGGWDMKIPGLSRSNGMPIIKVDNSPAKSKGVIYVLWADQRNGEDNTDVWFIRSVNYGDNWTIPINLGMDDSGKHQFLPWMTIDQTTGYIYVVYYDRRNYDDNRTDVYLSYSTDSGNTFHEVKISETPFLPTEDNFFGDYTNIAAHGGIIAPVWTRMDNGITSIWTTIIKQEDLIKAAAPPVKKKK